MLRTTALALSLAALAGTASAESFLERMAKQAAQAAAEKAGRAAMAKITASGGSTEAAPGAAAPAARARASQAPEVLTPKPRSGAARTAPAAAPEAAQPSGPAPWPVNAGAPDVERPGELQFSADTKALATAFDAFGRVSCPSCEGGRSYDSWARHSLKVSGEHGAWDKKLGALGLGQTLDWTGVESKGRITVVSETPVSGFRCKQLKWELFKGAARAERPGLVCFGYSGPYAASESWTEVF